ncbi:tyrosine-type recombinase/integrase [Haloarcula onubensis]|uniref:Tyrosine-type recombinase/integrase n=1 Tax=Haloarcula onubensis TaxID=2950539 RepID=A0ABU2FIS8_9EURY|nr:tyrosine-type recombinase/integrase [Halomicroarcula sp. S3CR25-11]MDS0280649.1 tyrosine-type recombinase/integrase [Halomicroarcula sp. S3CR25-11]
MPDDLEPLSPEEGVDRFLTHREPSVRESTLNNAKTRLRYFLDWCDERDVENLNSLSGRDMSDFVAWRRGDIAPITLQKQLSTIRQALRWWADIEAVDEGLAEKVHAPELPDGAESRDVHLDPDRAKAALEYYGRHRYASRDHALIALIWRTGMRRGAVQSLDRDDLEPDGHAVRLEHRIDEGTKLKNGEAGERWVYLGPKWFQILADYVDNPDRVQGTDEYGRKPLFTTQDGGRPSPQTIYKWLMRALHPCSYASCPHDRTPETCDARGRSANVADCPSSRSPHAVRRGAITHHLTEDTPPETVSERMDVSLDVLYQHYDARTEREKMDVRTNHLPDE